MGVDGWPVSAGEANGRKENAQIGDDMHLGAYGCRTTLDNRTAVNTKSPIAEKRREGPTNARQPTSKAETRLMNTPYTSKKNIFIF